LHINIEKMRKIRYNIVFITIFFGVIQLACAQLERVFVERYYVSDANDATDVLGGGVVEGSVTYRIFVDLAPGTVLKGIYGDEAHPFNISGSEFFFNNIVDGQTFAKDFIRNRYLENTVALDTWLTLGQTAKKQGNNTYYGVSKEHDDDGTFIGGVNNDGGSESISTGLLINEDPTIGLPLTVADGMDTMTVTPVNWFSNGLVDFMSGFDSTMFGSLVPKTNFYSTSFSLSSDGVTGVNFDQNQIIIAQLTTKGSLEFQINLEVEFEIDGTPTTIYYVGTNTITANNEIYSPFLSYPFQCGCNDPDYLEFNPSFTCLEDGSCQTPIVIGCLDTLACNYDPEANFNVEDLCCYPGWCSNRNIEEVCPKLKGYSSDFTTFPNPVQDAFTLNVISGTNTDIEYILYNYYGVVMRQKKINSAPLNYSETIDLSGIAQGIYHLRVITIHGEQQQLLVKI